MLFLQHLPLFCHLTLQDLRQAGGVVVLVVAALFIDAQKAVEQHDLPIGAQTDLAVRADHINRSAFQTGRRHLAGNRAFPDQIIQFALIGFGQFQRVGCGGHFGRTDALMRFLRVLGLVFIDARRVGHIGRAELSGDFGTRGSDGFGGHVDAVGAHIGDVAGLIQPLCRRHADLGPHAEFAAGFLLQSRGHERGRRVAGRGLGFDRRDGKCSGSDSLDRQFGSFGGGNIEFVQPFAAKRDQPRLIFLTARGDQSGGNRPEFTRPKRFDFHLAFDDQPQTDRLHPTRRLCARQFAPQHGRQGKADQIVQRPARQIGLDERQIDLARRFHRLGDGGFGDGVEGDATDLLALFEAAGQSLLQVPGNRLALAVRVGGEDQLVVGFQRFGDRLDVLAAVGGDFPGHVESVVRIDRTVFGGQVAHMAKRGKDRVVRSQIFVDCLGLGRRFDNDNRHENPLHSLAVR